MRRISKKSPLLICLLALGLTSLVARADLPRERVREVPRLFGREIERFVLLAPIHIDRSLPNVPFASTIMVRVTPGTFIPVTEDAEGIYYQAVNGFRTIRGNGRVGGGFFVSKTRPA